MRKDLTRSSTFTRRANKKADVSKMRRFQKRRTLGRMARCLFFSDPVNRVGATHRNRTDNLRITNALLCLVELGWLVTDESTALPIELRRRELVYLLRL